MCGNQGSPASVTGRGGGGFVTFTLISTVLCEPGLLLPLGSAGPVWVSVFQQRLFKPNSLYSVIKGVTYPETRFVSTINRVQAIGFAFCFCCSFRLLGQIPTPLKEREECTNPFSPIVITEYSEQSPLTLEGGVWLRRRCSEATTGPPVDLGWPSLLLVSQLMSWPRWSWAALRVQVLWRSWENGDLKLGLTTGSPIEGYFHYPYYSY